MPIPNATVAETTCTLSRMNDSCTFSLSGRGSPAWYAAAEKPRFFRSSATLSVSSRDRQYTIPESPRCCPI